MLVLDPAIVAPWVFARAGGAYYEGGCTAIGWAKDGALTAGVVYENYNHANVVCHIAGEGNWAVRPFLKVIFDYPFRQLKTKRITAPVASVNSVCQAFVKRLGFEHEATLIDAHPEGDILFFKMTADKCRWLEL